MDSRPFPYPLRRECPPGACDCDRERLLADAGADCRVLKLTREEEARLIAHIEDISSYAQLQKLGERIEQQLGVTLQIAPSVNEVRTLRGLAIRLLERPGLCRKTRKAVPAALRRCFERHPEIVYAILDAHDLFADG